MTDALDDTEKFFGEPEPKRPSCPTCDSPNPQMHPAVSNGGEVTKKCEDSFHSLAEEPPPIEVVTKLEDLSTEEVTQQAQALIAGNNQLIAWFMQKKIPLNGMAEARHEAFFDFLTEVGIISERNRALFEHTWATHLARQLNATRADVLKQIANLESEEIRAKLLHGVPRAAQMPPRNHRPSPLV